ncbi:MAG: TolB family protein, partial [Limisphaerales bacterium]
MVENRSAQAKKFLTKQKNGFLFPIRPGKGNDMKTEGELRESLGKANFPFFLFAFLLVAPLVSCNEKFVRPTLPPLQKTDSMADWSPDGKTIIYLHGAAFDTVADTSGLYATDTSGQSRRLLLPGAIYDATFSPDDQWVVFVTLRAIHKIKINRDSLTTLISDPDGEFFYPDWSPDGQSIAYDNYFPANNGIWIMNKDGANSKLVAPLS